MPENITLVTILTLLWTIPWKGLALWVAAQKQNRWWFIILLFVNTVGVLEIVYLIYIAKYKFTLPSLRRKSPKHG